MQRPRSRRQKDGHCNYKLNVAAFFVVSSHTFAARPSSMDIVIAALDTALNVN